MRSGTGPLEASRFSISVDGVQVGSFGQLWIARGPAGAPAREVLGHELTHTVQQQQQQQQQQGGRSTAPGPMLTVILKQVRLQQAAWMLFQAGTAATRRVTISASSAGGGAPVVVRRPKIALSAASTATPAQAKGTDVAMEELVLATEGLDL